MKNYLFKRRCIFMKMSYEFFASNAEDRNPCLHDARDLGCDAVVENGGHVETLSALSRVFQSRFADGDLEFEVEETLDTSKTGSESVVTFVKVKNCTSRG